MRQHEQRPHLKWRLKVFKKKQKVMRHCLRKRFQFSHSVNVRAGSIKVQEIFRASCQEKIFKVQIIKNQIMKKIAKDNDSKSSVIRSIKF